MTLPEHATPIRATNIRPEHAALIFSVSLVKNKRIFWILQISALLLFFLFGWFFLVCTTWLRPEVVLLVSLGVNITLQGIFLLLGSIILFLVFHEMLHGIFFWIFSRARPSFGVRGGYAYAAAPGWYFPPRQYAIIGLAPFIGLTILGLLLVMIVPVGFLGAVLAGMVTNAAGSVGDLWIIFLVMRERRSILIEDFGDGFNFYALS
jgi:hypothetical protein